jgi:hypothetical protein
MNSPTLRHREQHRRLGARLIVILCLLCGGQCFGADAPPPAWIKLLDLHLPSFATALQSPKQGTLGEKMQRFQESVSNTDTTHRRLPVYLSPRAAALPIAASEWEVTNVPVSEALKYLREYSQRDIRVTITDLGILITISDEAP